MKIDNALHDLATADIAFLGLNYYETCGEQGIGPELIRQALNSFSSYNMESKKDAFNELRICDLGDVKASKYDELKNKLSNVLTDTKATIITLGGEHLASLPVIEKLKPDNVIFLDAHADYYDEYAGRKYSYATVARRASEVSNVFISGVRDLTITEAKESINLLSREELLKKKFNGSLYVSVDLDVLDPIYCPEVSTPIPMGWTLIDLVKVLNKLCFSNNLLGLDVMELTAKTKGLSSVNAGGIIMNYLKRRCN